VVWDGCATTTGTCSAAQERMARRAIKGRLLRWPSFAKGSLSDSRTGFAALLAYEGYYRALAGGATIREDRPVRPDFEKPYLPRLAAARRFDAQHTPKALRRFVIDHLERIDFRRVDKFELV
jgi:hypothetical protein